MQISTRAILNGRSRRIGILIIQWINWVREGQDNQDNEREPQEIVLLFGQGVLGNR